MTVETVIGHDTAQIGVSREEDTEHVVDLTLVPQSTLEQTSHTGDGGGLVGVGLDTDAGVVADTQQVVDDLETLVTGGEVDTGDIGDLSELGGGVVLQEAHDGDNTGWRGVDSKLVLPNGELLDVLGQAGHNILSVAVQTIGHVLVLVGRVDDRGTEGARSCTRSNQLVQLQPQNIAKVIHIRGRCAWRMFSGSGAPGCVDAFAAYRSEDEEKERVALDLAAEATERPELRRIRERADAIVGRGAMAATRGDKGT